MTTQIATGLKNTKVSVSEARSLMFDPWIYRGHNGERTIQSVATAKAIYLRDLSASALNEYKFRSGVYVVKDVGRVLYVGATSSFQGRLQKSSHHALRYIEELHPDSSIYLLTAPDNEHLHLFERQCIEHFKPLYNHGGLGYARLRSHPSPICCLRGFIYILRSVPSGRISVGVSAKSPISVFNASAHADSIVYWVGSTEKANEIKAEMGRRFFWLEQHGDVLLSGRRSDDEFFDAISFPAERRSMFSYDGKWGYWYSREFQAGKPFQMVEFSGFF